MDIKNHEFNAYGVEIGQHYISSAVSWTGPVKPAPATDAEL